MYKRMGKHYETLLLLDQGDVRKNQDCERWVEQTCAQLGGLDILVNCAAGNFLVRKLGIGSPEG